MNPFEALSVIKAFWGGLVDLLALWPWFVGALLVGYLLGAWLGWKGAAVIAAILGLIAFLRRPKDTSVGWEDGEPPKKRRTPPPRRTVPGKRDWTSEQPWN